MGKNIISVCNQGYGFNDHDGIRNEAKWETEMPARGLETFSQQHKDIPIKYNFHESRVIGCLIHCYILNIVLAWSRNLLNVC